MQRRNRSSDDDDIPMDQMFAENPRVAICLVVVMFVQGLSHNMMFAHLEDLNADFAHPLARAKLGSAFLTANGIANLFWGQICDRYGQRLGILASLLFQTVGSGVLACATTLDIAILGRVLSGISSNVTLTRAYAGRTSNSSNQPLAFSLIIGAFGAAVSMVPLCSWIPDQNQMGNNSAAITAWIVMGATCLAAVLSFLFLPYLAPPTREASSTPSRSMPLKERARDIATSLWSYRLCFLSAMSYSACTFLLQAPDHVIITQTVQRAALKWLFSIQGFTRMVFTLFVYPRICKRWPVVTVTKFAIAMMIVTIPSVYLTSLIENTTLRYIAEAVVFALRGINLSMGLTGSAQLVNNASPPRYRTTITGLSQSVASLSQTGNVAVLATILHSNNNVKGPAYYYLTIAAMVAAAMVFWGIPPMLSNPIHVEQVHVVTEKKLEEVQMESFSSVDGPPPPPPYEVVVADSRHPPPTQCPERTGSDLPLAGRSGTPAFIDLATVEQGFPKTTINAVMELTHPLRKQMTC